MYRDVETFVSRQLELLKHEREAEIQQTRLLQENVSFKQLQGKGVCLLNLSINQISTGLYGRTVVSFGPRLLKELPSHDLSPGDIVGIFPASSSTNTESEQLSSGIISRSGNQVIEVAIDHNADELDDDGQYRIVKLANDVTYRRLKQGLELLKNLTGPGLSLLNILFGDGKVSEPLTAVSPQLLDRDGRLSFHNENLDNSQRQAVEFALRQKEIGIIHGPPGTGKTTTVVEIILQMVKSGNKILVCAPSNIAVDNLVEKLTKYPRVRSLRLGHPSRMTSTIQERSLDAIIASSDSAKIVQEVRRELDSQLAKLRQRKRNRDESRGQLGAEIKSLRKELRERESKTMKEILKNADVVLATLTSATDEGPLKHLAEDHFDYVVIDECSQATEAACWLALVRARRALLAGDHLQLPPTILSSEAASGGLAVSLMERLEKKFGEKCVRMLTTQYRMHEKIMQWSSEKLYEGKLEAHRSVAGHLLEELRGVESNEDTCSALLLIDTCGADCVETAASDEGSKANPGEASLVAIHVERLIKAGIQPADIAIITPYNLQVDLLRQMLSSRYSSLEIKSVDGFQGREKEAVILSLVRSNDSRQVGFLADIRRLNVAVTRARRHLCVITDTSTTSAACGGLLEHIEEHGEVRSALEYSAEMDSVVLPQFDYPLERQPKNSSSSRTSEKISEKIQKPKRTEAEVVQQFQKKLEDFKKSQKKLLEFPSSLNSFERRVVHDIADKLGLHHQSSGEDKRRKIVVSKEQIIPGKSESNESKPNISESVDSEDINTGTETGETLENGEQIETIVEIPESVVELKSLSIDSSKPAAKESISQTEIDMQTCPKCQKKVPISNFALHELRCLQPSQSQGGARPKQKKLVKNLTALQKAEDDDEVLEMFRKMDNVCNYTHCKEKISCFGQLCRFCNRRFCLSHHIPEVHGCGEEARTAARQMTIRQGVITPGSGVSKPKVDPVKRAHLHRKLEKKVNELSSKRVGTNQKKK